MEFEIAKEGFSQALSLAQGVVERRNTLPILANVLITSVERGLSLLATDLDIGVRRFCTCTVHGQGSITVNARKLFEIVRAAPGDLIVVRALENYRVEVSSGRYNSKLIGLDPKEFPSIPGLEARPSRGAVSIQTSAAMLRSMIERTVFAVSIDETRLNLSGVYSEAVDGCLRMVATDGHRLSMIDRRVEGELPTKGAILPRKGLAEVRKALDAAAAEEKVTLVIDGSLARVVCGDSEVFMSLVDGEFPDYRQVIPKEGKISVSVERDQLLAALIRVSLLASERSRGVRLCLTTGVLELRTNNPDQGEASEDLEVAYRGDEIAIGFNARYLTEVLGVLPEGKAIELTVSDDVSPGVLRSEDDEQFCYVVMPMRL